MGQEHSMVLVRSKQGLEQVHSKLVLGHNKLEQLEHSRMELAANTGRDSRHCDS